MAGIILDIDVSGLGVGTCVIYLYTTVDTQHLTNEEFAKTLSYYLLHPISNNNAILQKTMFSREDFVNFATVKSCSFVYKFIHCLLGNKIAGAFFYDLKKYTPKPLH